MKKNLIILFSFNFILRIFLQGLLPLYAFIAEKLGASKQNNGLLLASCYTMLLFGTWLCGKIIPRFTNVKTVMLVSLIPLCLSLAFFGMATSLLPFLICSIILFFSAGLNITASIIFIGYYSTKINVGKNFGIFGLSNLLGTLIGGFVVGPVLFSVGNYYGFLLFAIILSVIGLLVFFVDKPIINTTNKKKAEFKLTRKFCFLMLSSVLVLMLIHIFHFSFSLSLKSSGYNIKEISLFSGFGTAICLPMPYLFGKWTLRYKAKNLLIIIYLLMVVGLSLLLLPKMIPIILLGVACMSILAYASPGVIIPLIFSWFTEETLPMAQSYLGVAAWLAAIFGYLFTGFSLQHLNFVNTISIGIIIGLVATVILWRGVKSHQGID